MPPHHLTNFEMQKYYQYEPKFNGVYSRNNLPKIKDGAYLLEKTLVLFIMCSKCKNKDEKIFKEEESFGILNILGLIQNI